MANFFEILVEVLNADERFFTEDGTLLRNKVYESAMNMDVGLIGLLLGNAETKKRFFAEVNGTFVFDKVGFGWVVNNRQFLPDSYTHFKNRIGLTDARGDLISTSNDVVLSFPYKDCVLEGGQSRDDQKRDEVFYNATLAPDEVDRLLYPKVLIGARRYTASGVEERSTFEKSDNLIIKGNNLLSLASLLKLYEGKIKCIYIDVPYNTGNDSFGYNDRFNQSTWLVFMKNRLQIARRLLARNGTIAISVDNYEIGYLQVLLDEIFGRENRKNIITVKRGSVTGAKVINPGVVNVVEYIVLYSKDTTAWKPNRVYATKDFDTRYNSFICNFETPYDEWVFTTVLEAWASEIGVIKSKLKKHFGGDYENELNRFALNNANKICQLATIDDGNVGQDILRGKQESLKNPDKIIVLTRDNGAQYYVKNGKHLIFASDNLMEIDGQRTFSQPITDIWDDVLPNDLHNEGGVELKKGKKPEKLLQRLLELCTSESDLVLDFFAGSGTTGAVAHKMNRRYILCEQMDYIETITRQRLQNVVMGDTRGISKAVGWKGGGSFVYCKLAKSNQHFADEVASAKTNADLTALLERVLNTGFISSKVNPSEIAGAAADFEALSIEDKKRFILELLDKNMLYVNLCDLDDEEYAISEADKAFTRSFYGLEGDRV
jgi:adenine-specific DNA-methyltransferase